MGLATLILVMFSGCEKEATSPLIPVISVPENTAYIFNSDSASLFTTSNGEMLVSRDRKIYWGDTAGHTLILEFDSAGNPYRFYDGEFLIRFESITDSNVVVLFSNGDSSPRRLTIQTLTKWDRNAYAALAKGSMDPSCGYHSADAKWQKFNSLAISWVSLVAMAASVPATGGGSLVIGSAFAAYGASVFNTLAKCVTPDKKPTLEVVPKNVFLACYDFKTNKVLGTNPLDCLSKVLDRASQIAENMYRMEEEKNKLSILDFSETIGLAEGMKRTEELQKILGGESYQPPVPVDTVIPKDTITGSKFGHIKVLSPPHSSAISINGIAYGQTPMASFIKVPAGIVKIHIAPVYIAPFDSAIWIGEDESLTLNVKLDTIFFGVPAKYDRNYEFGELVILDSSNSRSGESIMRVLRQHSPALTQLYIKYAQNNPGLKGRIAFRFSILPTGIISDSRIVSSTTGDSAFDVEARLKLETWRFEPVKSTVTSLATFSPKGCPKHHVLPRRF
jgi:hypothetical protein